MSSVWLLNNVCSASRTPSGSPRNDVTISKCSSVRWERKGSGSCRDAGSWLAATMAAAAQMAGSAQTSLVRVTPSTAYQPQDESSCWQTTYNQRAIGHQHMNLHSTLRDVRFALRSFR